MLHYDISTQLACEAVINVIGRSTSAMFWDVAYLPALLESEGFPPKIFGGKKNLISATWRKFPPSGGNRQLILTLPSLL